MAFDEQIFAVQPYGGISRMFAELAAQFLQGAVPGVELLPLNAPVVNHYLLENPELRARLRVTQARSQWTALGRYFSRVRSAAGSDVVHNTFYLPHGLTPTRGAKRVVTVHDMIPELMPQTRRRLDFLTLKRRYVESADHIICVSEATKQDLLKVYGLMDAPISVIHHGVDARFSPDPVRLDFLPERYLLFVGHRASYKDVGVLFEAFARLAKHDPALHLLCVGGDDLSQAELVRLRDLGVESRVKHRYLADTQMASAYTHAEAFVFPSHFEGFGMPVLEAMACGTPAVLAAATSLPEVGGDAAAYFEPGDARGLAEVIERLLGDRSLREALVGRGRARVAQFTWQRAAEQTAAVYRATLGEVSSGTLGTS